MLRTDTPHTICDHFWGESGDSATVLCSLCERKYHEGAIYSASNEDRIQGFKTKCPSKESIDNLPPVHLVMLTHASNIFTPIGRLQPRSVDKLTRINHSYLRDMSSRSYISFIEALFDIADVGTKGLGGAHLFLKLCRYRKFALSF